MVLPDVLFDYLERLLLTRPILYPEKISVVFPDGYEPIHKKCYRTARKVQQLMGCPVIAGISLLDKDNKLLPWPHMVNAKGASLVDGLIDASPKVDQPEFGFVPIFLNETQFWNEVTSAYSMPNEEGNLVSSWGDANADKLTQSFLSQLRVRASVAKLETGKLAIPEGMPEAEE